MARKMKTMDGNNAAASRILCVYRRCRHLPHHPFFRNGGSDGQVVLQTGRKTCSAEQVKVTEMQSEAGAAGAVHGSLAGRCADHHLYRFSGPFADDPQHV